MAGIVFFILAAAMLVVHFIALKSNQKTEEVFQGKATIEGVNFSDRGTPWHTVSLVHNGKVVKGKTSTRNTVRNWNPGDEADVEYSFTSGDKIWADIIDDIYLKEKEKAKSGYTSNFFLKVSIVLAVIGVIGVILSFL